MTSNQLTYRGQQLEKEKLDEQKRHNIVSEIMSPLNAAIGGGSRIASRAVHPPLKTRKDTGGWLSPDNDPIWYGLDPQLVKDVASISFHYPLGASVVMQNAWIRDNTTGDTISTVVNVPGIMQLKFIPTLGALQGGLQNGNDWGDTPNVAAKNLYSFVRHANSGSRNYEPADLLQYILAIDSLYIAIGWGMRTYSLANEAKIENRYYPSSYVEASGFRSDITDGDSIMTNLADFRAHLNSVIVRANALALPASLPLFSRHMFLVLNIFKDAPVKKSQNYLFVPQTLYKYIDSVGVLQAVSVGTSLGVTDYFTLLESLLAALMNSEDAGIISGDILKAFGEENLFILDTIDAGYHVESGWSSEVLSQIHNSTVLPVSSASIGQDSRSNLVYGSYNSATNTFTPNQYGLVVQSLSGQYPLTSRGYIINMYTDEVTSDDVMVATRLVMSTNYIKADSAAPVCYVEAAGSEIVVGAIMFTNGGGGTFVSNKYNYLTSVSSIAQQAAMLEQYSAFDWAPQLWTHASANASPLPMFEMENYALIVGENIHNMHHVAFMSELGVPMYGMTRRKPSSGSKNPQDTAKTGQDNKRDRRNK